MPTIDPRVDSYIARSADFAKPILKHIRAVVHAGCPDCVETIKWSFPCFDYKGMFCSMAGFKQHCTFGFAKHSLIVPEEKKQSDGMGQFGRITSIDDLPPKKVFLAYIKEAKRLNDEGIKPPKAPKKPKAPLTVPTYFKAALKKNQKAQATFDNFSPSHQREYVEWITEAKQEATREKRLKQAIEWLAEGKARNWKYENC